MFLTTPHLQNVDDSLSRFFHHWRKIGLLYGNAPLTRLAMYGVTSAAVTHRSVWVIDGANSFDAYFVARLARRWNYASESILSHIHLSRAFTCYQLTESITRRLDIALPKPGRDSPSKPDFDSKSSHRNATIFCIGLLDTFYDDAVPLTDAVRLLKAIIVSLAELAKGGHTVFITAREPRQLTIPKRTKRPEDRRVLLNLLVTAATHTQRIDWIADEATMPVATQLQLIVA